MYTIHVQGKASFGATPSNYIADMLRYDQGHLISITPSENDQVPNVGQEFEAIIQCDRFTQDRWHSFGLGAGIINKP